MILVTGASGNVGRNVVRQLLEAGEAVRAMTRDPQRVHFPEGVEVVPGDLSLPETLDAALAGVSRAFLFPVHGHLRAFLERGRRVGLQGVVLLSSAAVQAPTENAIGRAHAAAEAEVEASGLPWTHLRPVSFMANDLRWAGQIRASGVVRAPHGQAGSAPVDERDIAAVAVAALRGDAQGCTALTLTGPESLTVVQRVAILAEVLGRPVRFQELSPEQARAASRDVPAEVLEFVLANAAAMVGRRAETADTVQRVTGMPAHTYRQWAEHHVADF